MILITIKNIKGDSMEKNSFVIYHDWEDTIKCLNNDQISSLFLSLMGFSKRNEEPEFEDVAVKAIFTLLKSTIQRDREKYVKRCEKNRESGKIGGEKRRDNLKNTQKVANGSDCYKNEANLADNDNVNDNDKEKEIIKEKEDKITTSEETSTVDNDFAKASKHKYGEYNHVMLKDEELQTLNELYGEEKTKQLITYLDEYIEMKGYKAKSHYLCIRKWVVDAVSKRKDVVVQNVPKWYDQNIEKINNKEKIGELEEILKEFE